MYRLKILTDDEVEQIHRASLQVLEETGVIMGHPEGVEILRGAGARIDSGRVRIPGELVEKCLASCPNEVRLRGRGGEVALFGSGQLHWHNLGGAPEVYDAGADRHRPAILQDVMDSARLLDALEGATTITPFFTPRDTPGELMSIAMYRHTLANTTKPLHGPAVQRSEEVRLAARMVEVVGPAQEYLTLGISPVSPLTFHGDQVGAMIEAARLKITVGPLPCPTAGATGPMSIAGSLTQQHAENLAAIVLLQLVQHGLPVIYSGRLSFMEPRTGLAAWGGPEVGMASAVTVQIGHRYRLPVNVYGFATNDLRCGLQSGYERALNAVIPAIAGADELSGIGELSAGTVGSYAQMVVDSELAASVRRIREGVRVDEDSLAVAVINQVMEGEQNYLAEEHTLRYLRSGEITIPRLAESGNRQTWETTGKQDLVQRAQAEAERLIQTHHVEPLSDDQERELDQMMGSAGAEGS